MPIYHETFEVGTTAVQILKASANPIKIELHNDEHDAAHNIFIGASDVTASDGFHLPPESTMELSCGAGDELWAISDHEGGATLNTLRIEAV